MPADAFVAVCTAFFYAPKALVYRGRGIKGHDTLLEAWSAFRQSGGRGRLLLVGGGFGADGERHRADLQAWARSLPGASSVTWVDSVEDVRRFYAAADVSVSPSLSENYRAVAEAAASGVPSIATRVGGLPELVDEWTGFLVPPGDPSALTASLHQARRAHQSGELRRLGAAARERAVAQLELSARLAAYCSRMEALAAA